VNNPRHFRRGCAIGAFAVGVGDLVLAASARAHLRVHSLFVEWAYEAVVGARYFLLLAGVVLIVTARGLLRGKRNGWRLAMLAAIGSIVSHHVKGADGIGLALGIALLLALVLGRRAFGVRADPLLVRDGWRVLALGELIVFVYGAVGLYRLDDEFADSTTLLQSVREAARLLVLLPANSIQPIARHGDWFVGSVRVAALIVVLVALTRVVSSVAVGRGTERDEHLVESLLEQWADTSLAYFQLLDDKHWFLASDGGAFIGYVLVGTVAVALGAPVGAPVSCDLATDEFLELCALNGWVAANHQVTPEGAVRLGRHGMKALKIGEEAVVAVQTWDVDDKRYKSLRSALRRIERSGLHLVELAHPLSDHDLAELRAVSDAWLEDSGHRERTFTVGQFGEQLLQSTRVLALREQDTGRIVAFANILPSYRSEVGNFDLMRRRPDAPNGAMDALFVGLIHHFRDAGMTGMTLGLVPFVNADSDTLASRAVRLLYERGEAAFNAQGLFRFKDKWIPRWEPRYLTYQRDVDLPLIAAAVVRAGELPDPRSPRTKVLRTLQRFPFTTALIGVIVWLMSVTAIDADSFPPLLRNLGLRWDDLLHLQFWRLGTSQLIQDRAGLVWSIVALTFVAAPIAEWRIGTRRSIITFFIGDWISTIIVLASARLLEASSHAAALHIGMRDSGSSSGGWALAVVTACSLRSRRWRTVALVAMIGFLTVALVAHRRIFDIQHFISAMTALGLGHWWFSPRQRGSPERSSNDAIR
jgi:phosphatidylglycerol lysyltransferase